MQWKLKPPKPKPSLGDKRVITRFAWLSTVMSDKQTVVWLESYRVYQEYQLRTQTYHMPGGITMRDNFTDWVDVKLEAQPKVVPHPLDEALA